MASIGVSLLSFSVIMSVVAGLIVALGVLPTSGIIAPNSVNTTGIFTSVISPGDSFQTQASDPFGALRTWNLVGIISTGFFVVSPVLGFVLQFGLASNPVIVLVLGAAESIRLYYSALGVFEIWKGADLS